MKPNIRWQLMLAVGCLGLVFALLSFQAQTVGLCSTRVPASGGNLVEGIVGSPQYLNPLLSDGNPVDRELVALIFDGLTRYSSDGELQPSLAEEWQIAEDGLSVTFTLRDDIFWHDGEPITSEDVLFSYGLLQEPSFAAPEELRNLWQSVQISSSDARHISFTLPEPYAPFLDMTTRGIIPAHIFEGVLPSEIADHRFNQFPVGSGPFMASAEEDWSRSGKLNLLPNPTYWPQGTQLNGLQMRFFPDNASLMAAFRAGEIQAINSIPPSLLSEYLALPGLRLYTAPSNRQSQLLFNLTDTGLKTMESLEVRQALALGVDRERLVDDVLYGQGLPLEGPYPPSSWAYDPAALTQYDYDPIAAEALLDAAGWSRQDGAQFRQLEGTTLEVRLLFWDVPPYREIAERMAQDWEQLGIRVQPLPQNLSAFRDALAARSFDVALVDVTPPGDPDLYDFWSQEAIVRGQNYAGWNNRRASEALEQGRQKWPVSERLPFYQTFLAHYANDLPALTLFQYVYNYGISDTVNDVEIGLIGNPRERYTTLPDWFLLFKSVTVVCPEESTP